MEMIMKKSGRAVSLPILIRIVPILGAISACAVASPNTVNVSMAELIMDPAPYVGQTVAVTGYFKRHANLHLFLTDDHAEILDFESSILLSDTDEGDLHQLDCLERHVRVVGMLIAHSHGSYAIVDIQRIDDPGAEEVCWERK